MCLVDLLNADLVDAPSSETIGITGAIPGYVGATHFWSLLIIL